MFVLVIHWAAEATNHSKSAMLANTNLASSPDKMVKISSGFI